MTEKVLDLPTAGRAEPLMDDLTRTLHHRKVSLPTIIERAKKHVFYLKKPKKSLTPRKEVNLRLYPLNKEVSEIRF